MYTMCESLTRARNYIDCINVCTFRYFMVSYLAVCLFRSIISFITDALMADAEETNDISTPSETVAIKVRNE